MPKIRFAIAGVGNCASSLIQGLCYYKDVDESSEYVPGLLYPVLGGYKPSDLIPVAAFDVDANKVGKDLSEAIFSPPNNTEKIIDVPKLGVEVMMAPPFDGLGENLKKYIKVSEKKPVDVADVLRENKVDVLVNIIPTGAHKAAFYYADQAIEAKAGFVNGMPTLVVCNKEYQKKAIEKNVPLIGDDVKSQVGGTALHRALLNLLVKRGVKVLKTYQINFGGNMDFLNLLERGESKVLTKSEALKPVVPYEFEEWSGPTGYIPWMKDMKVCYIYIEGRKFGNVPLKIWARLEVIDSYNSAGILIDMIRCCKLAMDRNIGGPLIEASAFFAKHPPKQFSSDEEAFEALNKFIGKEKV